jgi:GTP cyclohydrolase I
VTILENLGYNEKRWNRDKTPSAIDKDWSRLTSQQRADLGQLGFDAYSWDGTPPPNNQIPVPNPAPAPASSPLASGDYTDTDWEDLPDFARNILENLGYNENRWCDDDTPSAIDKDWSRLTSQQRADLGRLGFREGNW